MNIDAEMDVKESVATTAQQEVTATEESATSKMEKSPQLPSEKESGERSSSSEDEMNESIKRSLGSNNDSVAVQPVQTSADRLIRQKSRSRTPSEDKRRPGKVEKRENRSSSRRRDGRRQRSPSSGRDYSHSQSRKRARRSKSGSRSAIRPRRRSGSTSPSGLRDRRQSGGYNRRWGREEQKPRRERLGRASSSDSDRRDSHRKENIKSKPKKANEVSFTKLML